MTSRDPARDPLRGDFESPTRYGLDEVIERVYGGQDTKFDRLVNDHFDGIAPKAHAELWRRLLERIPSASSIEEVVRAWTRAELFALYQSIVKREYAAAAERARAQRDA